MKSLNFTKIFLISAISFVACNTSHTVMIGPDGKKIVNVVSEDIVDTVTVKKELVQRDTIYVPDTVTVMAPMGTVKDTVRVDTVAPAPKRVAVRPQYDPNDKYYMFDAQKSTALWKKWRGSNPQLTQDEYFETIDLCCVAYDYFINECQSILDSGLTQKAMAAKVADLDTGKGCTMLNFTTNLSIQLNKCASAGQLDEENVELLKQMADKKRQYKALRKQLP